MDPTYVQMVLELPPDAAINGPAFVHDNFQSFTRTIFLGQEVRRSATPVRTLAPALHARLRTADWAARARPHTRTAAHCLRTDAIAPHTPCLHVCRGPRQVRLFVFEAIFFCAIDMALSSAATSAFITYVVWRTVAWLRASWGEDNLAQKTLVDRHFLI